MNRPRCPECSGPIYGHNGSRVCDSCRQAWAIVLEEAEAGAVSEWKVVTADLPAELNDIWLTNLRPVMIRDDELVLTGFSRVRNWVAKRYPDLIAAKAPDVERVSFAPPRAAAAMLRRKQINERKENDGSGE